MTRFGDTVGLKLPYLQYRTNKLLYRRRYPADVKNLFDGKSVYYKQLACKVNAPREVVLNSWLEINESFETLLNTTRNTFDEEIADERISREAKNWLRIHNLKPGVFRDLSKIYHHQPWDMGTSAFDDLEQRYRDSIEYSEKHPHFDDFHLRHPPTPKQKIIHKAWQMAAGNLAKIKEKRLLSECWDIYVANRQEGFIDKTTREGKRIYASWNRLLSYIKGDCLLEDTETIYQAIDEMIRDREKTVSNASIERDWIVISAVLNSVIKVERLNLKFHKPIIKKHTPKDRPVFSQTDQIAIVNAILTNQYPVEQGILMLLALQAGIINSELQRLEKKNVRLDEEIPHILITGKTKTNERKRTVPITVGLQWLRRGFQALEDGSRWAMGEAFSTAKDSTISKRIVTSLQSYSIRDKKNYSCYSFRHCFKGNAIAHNASERYLYIAGWVNKEAVISDTYAQDAMTQTAVLKGIQETSKVVNKHLIELDILRVVDAQVS